MRNKYCRIDREGPQKTRAQASIESPHAALGINLSEVTRHRPPLGSQRHRCLHPTRHEIEGIMASPGGHPRQSASHYGGISSSKPKFRLHGFRRLFVGDKAESVSYAGPYEYRHRSGVQTGDAQLTVCISYGRHRPAQTADAVLGRYLQLAFDQVDRREEGGRRGAGGRAGKSRPPHRCCLLPVPNFAIPQPFVDGVLDPERDGLLEPLAEEGKGQAAEEGSDPTLAIHCSGAAMRRALLSALVAAATPRQQRLALEAGFDGVQRVADELPGASGDGAGDEIGHLENLRDEIRHTMRTTLAANSSAHLHALVLS